MSETRARVIQYVFILTALLVLASVGWWYYHQSQASTKLQNSQAGSLTNGLQGYWPLDGDTVVWTDTTTELKDKSGNNRHMNSSGLGIDESVPGRIGQGLLFTPGGGAYGVTTNSFNAYTTGTISMWFKYSGTPGQVGTSGTLWDHEDCGNNKGQFQIAMDTDNSELYLWMTQSGAGCTAAIGASVNLPNPTAWHHFVFTDDTGGHKLYIDGILQTLTYASGNASIDFFLDNVVGSSNTPQIGEVNNENFSGTLDEVRIYNRALSADEAWSLYRLGQVTINTRPGDDVLEEGLAGYWKVDEGTGTSTTADATGNGNSATMTNMESGDWVAGQVGPYALDFDGTNEYLSVTDPASGVLDFADSTNFALTGWFNRDTFAADHTVIAKKNDQTTNQGYVVWVDNNGSTDTLIFEASDGTDTYQVPSKTQFNATGWHHFAVNWNDTAGVSLYIDGHLDTGTPTGTFANVNVLSNALAFRVGAESDAGVPFDGKLDEIRVYRRALSAGEVSLLYLETHPDDPNTNLVGYWTFDGMDVSGTTAIDRGRGGNTGTLTGGPTVTPGRIGQALKFDGVDDYVNAGVSAVLDDIATLSTCAWINPRSAGEIYSGSDRFGGIVTEGIPGGWFFMTTNVYGSVRLLFYVYFSGTDGAWYPTSDTIPLNTWTHVCFTYNNTSASNDPVLYINGASVSLTEDSTPTGTVDSNAGSELHIGTNDVTDQVFDGLIDDVRVYDTALTQTQVTELYRSTGGKAITASSGNDTLRSGLVGLWSMDGQDVNWADTTTEVKDDTAGANHGDATNMSAASVAPGRVGQAIDLDGTDDYISVTDTATLDFTDTADLTLSGWFNRDTATTDDTLIAKSNGITAGDTGYLVYLDDATDQLIFEVSDGTDEYSLTSTTTFTTTGWHHYTITWDQDSAANSEIYIDGTANSATDTGTIGNIGDLSNALAFRVGAESDNGNPSDGKIDDVRVYSRVLSASEVTQLYNMGR
ncbi:MAG: LamG domain-containing protein [Candidatus Moraniibacteriota bacterium]|nr:MAG: LamG domain-containing protein [Candidatus Moranbacteria bacterium]